MKHPVRASIRVAKKTIEKKFATSLRKKRVLEKALKKGNVWSAVIQTYNKTGNNTSARNIVSPVFRPKYRYNPNKNVIINNSRNVNKAITKALLYKNIIDIIIPLVGQGKRGGVDPNYVKYAMKHANVKYAVLNKNTKGLHNKHLKHICHEKLHPLKTFLLK